MAIDFDKDNKEEVVVATGLSYDEMLNGQTKPSNGFGQELTEYLGLINDILPDDFTAVINALDYTYITIAKKAGAKASGKVAYFTLVLARSGVASMSPAEYLGLLRTPNSKIALPSRGINNHLDSAIESKLKFAGLIGAKTTIISLGGLVIDATAALDETTAAYSVSEAVNDITVFLAEYDEANTGVKLRTFKKISVLNMPMTGTVFSPAPGETRYATGGVQVKGSLTLHENYSELNTGGSETIASAVYSVQPIIMQSPEGRIDRETNMVENISLPIIAISAIETPLPTTGSALLAIHAVAEVTTSDRGWLKPLLQNIGPGRDPGSLAASVRVSPTAKFGKIDLTKGFSLEEKVRVTLDLIEDKPVIALDIPAFGFGAGQLQAFVDAANNVPGAAQSIIDAAKAVTDGRFNEANVNASNIIAGVSTMPVGSYTSKTGNISTDEIGVLYVGAHKKAAELEPLVIETMLADGTSEERKVELLAAVDTASNNIQISGHKTRVYLNGAFLDELSVALAESGVAMETERGESYSGSAGFQRYNSIYNAHIQGRTSQRHAQTNRGNYGYQASANRRSY